MKAILCCMLFCLPLKHLSITSDFGYRVHPITGKYSFHSGIDLHASHDTVYAITNGLLSNGFNHFLGIYITITNGDLQITYGHLSQALPPGSVQAGDAIGLTGSTGRVTGEHLHLSIKYNGHYIDPLKFLYELTIK